MKINTCEECNNAFKIKDKSKANKFCSKPCYSLHRSKNRIHVADKTIKIIKCFGCDSILTNPIGPTKFCSLSCRENNELLKRNAIINSTESHECTSCKSSYKTLNKKSKFCSRVCYWNFRNDNPSIKIQSNQGVKCKTPKICKHCNVEYSTWNYRANSLFCSVSCHKLYRHCSLTCPTCKQVFSTPQHIDRKYCSTACANKGVDKRKSKFSTSTEAALNKLQLNFEPEYPIVTTNSRYSVDFIIDSKYIIECYGDYWHCNPIKYDASYYHKQIRKTANDIWDFDKNRMYALQKLGYIVIFIWEAEWYKNKNYINLLTTKLRNSGYEF